jgi:hypothetical protein
MGLRAVLDAVVKRKIPSFRREIMLQIAEDYTHKRKRNRKFTKKWPCLTRNNNSNNNAMKVSFALSFTKP